MIDQIFITINPEPKEYHINGELYRLWGHNGWTWSNEDGDCQEDYGMKPFAKWTDALQDAMYHQETQSWGAAYDHADRRRIEAMAASKGVTLDEETASELWEIANR